MKEKIKNILKNKCFWHSVLECLCTIFIIIISYFIGFSNGLLIDNEIRQEIIDTTTDFDLSNNDIKIDKKEIIESNIPTNVYLGTISSTLAHVNHIDNADIEYLISFAVDININVSINNDNIIFSDVSYTFSVFLNEINFLENTRLARYTYSYPLTYNDFEISLPKNFNGQNYYLPLPYFIVDSDLGPTMVSFLIDNNFNVYNNLFYYNSTYDFTALTSWYQQIGIQISNDYGGSFNLSNIQSFYENYILLFTNVSYDNGVYSYESNFYLTMYNNYLSSWIVSAFGGASSSDLEQAYQQGFNIGYQSGVIEGANEYKSSQEYRDELEEEYNKGYQARQDSVEEQEQVTNNIWTILEKGIETTLNVLSMEILPGIPLFICIAIPILIGVLIWVVKLGAQ